ncbi:mitochondrial genome maintenance [Fusarium albosuccineum]|uniref:Mitochondrial genome maintenance protein MGM101 n=1 Tax=Fusarium albosuccineum TaxID=1237068 RepID=A0A8H4LF21_9HYPO|nr:mitochondrial genome maintenance [Fusarium albosuccineum]
MSKEESDAQKKAEVEDDDEPDECIRGLFDSSLSSASSWASLNEAIMDLSALYCTVRDFYSSAACSRRNYRQSFQFSTTYQLSQLHPVVMFVPRRALFPAQRLPLARSRPIVPLVRYSTEAAAASPAPKADVKPAEDVKQVNQKDAWTPFEKPASKTWSKPIPTPYTKKTVAAPKPAPRKASTTTKAAAPAKPSPATNDPPPNFETAPMENSVSSPAPTESLNEDNVMLEERDVVSTKGFGVHWDGSTWGISCKAVSPAQAKILLRPLKPQDVEVKPDGIIYLPEVKYRRRLHEAFGPMGWGMLPRGEAVVGPNIVTREYGLIVEGRFVAQAQGVNNYFSPENVPTAIEGCKSNALMRCCKDLGIASELWDPIYLRWFRKNHMVEAWVEHATTKKKRTLWFKKGLLEPVYPWKLV